MPSFNPFSSVSSWNCVTLFEIRLDDDVIVFRGNADESASQLLQGVVVLCLSSQLKVDDVHLRLRGTLRSLWAGSKVTSTTIQHRWAPFLGGSGRSVALQPGNYEWPFEFNLPGNIAESVEGIPEASITYRLKATVARGKLAYNSRAYKPLRIIRTLQPAALESIREMSVGNIWPNKVDFSIVIPRNAVVFGAVVPLVMRFTPLVKGLEMGETTAKLQEILECSVHGPASLNAKDHRTERDVASWTFRITREEHWHDTIEDTGKEGWVVDKKLDLPKKLGQCTQDLNHHGIKHKLKLTVALKNPDGRISELRATLPVSIFISLNMSLDEQGNLVGRTPGGVGPEVGARTIAPPGYREHILDQLYDSNDMSCFRMPRGQSVNGTYCAQSSACRAENLTGPASVDNVTPAALSHRLHNLSLDPPQGNLSFNSFGSSSGMPAASPTSNTHGSGAPSLPQPANLCRNNSEEHHPGRNSPEHTDFPELSELNKVPSYATTRRTPAPSRAYSGRVMLPDYESALIAFGMRPAPAMATADPLLETSIRS